MTVKVFIPYHPKLDKYLDKVIRQFSIWDGVITREADFDKEGQVKVRNEFRDINADLVFTIDADEFILRKHQRKLVQIALDGNFDAIFCKPLMFSRDKQYIHKPLSEHHRQVVLADPKKCKFYQTRCIDHENAYHTDSIKIYHLSLSVGNIDWKKRNYWNIGNPNEVSKWQEQPKKPHKLPDELRELLND